MFTDYKVDKKASFASMSFCTGCISSALKTVISCVGFVTCRNTFEPRR